MATLRASLKGTHSLPEYVRVKSFFSRKECDSIIEDLVLKTRFYRTNGSALAKRVSISYLEPQRHAALATSLYSVAAGSNSWKLRLTGIIHPMRIQEYRRGDYNDVHADYDYVTQDYSKLTIVVSLLDRNRWDGGDLHIGNTAAKPKINMGDAIVFPSFQPHSVSRVLRGRRLVLSAWISGPPLT
jgi:hypothetical protein